MPVLLNKGNAPFIVKGKIVPAQGSASFTDEEIESFAGTPAGKAHLSGSLKISAEEEAVEPNDNDASGFVFDPEVHHVEHRGGGKWYVMDQEEKVHGPISKDDADKYKALIEENGD